MLSLTCDEPKSFKSAFATAMGEDRFMVEVLAVLLGVEAGMAAG